MHGGMQANHHQEGCAQGGANLGEGHDRCGSASIQRHDAAHTFSAMFCAPIVGISWETLLQEDEGGGGEMKRYMPRLSEDCFEQVQ